MPVFGLAMSRAEHIDWWAALGMFVALHLFIYPASNGYNSYIDRDEGPIGGLEKPPLPTRNLFWATLIFDVVGLGIVLTINWIAFCCVLAYMIASRAYSSPQLRLKSMPLVGFFTVIVFQGAVTFAMVYLAVAENALANLEVHWPAVLGSSLLIAGAYPLTQVYQHEEDAKNGDRTISLLLGYRGTFEFSMLAFLFAVAFLYLEFSQGGDLLYFGIVLGFLVPSLGFFNWWMFKVWKDNAQANFRNTMRMNFISSTAMNLAFTLITVLQL